LASTIILDKRKGLTMLENRQIEFNEVIEWIREELGKACHKFPEWPEDAIHAVNVISEEAGELQKVANEATYEPGKFGYDPETDKYDSPLSSLRKEAVQTAAMAIRFLMHLHHYKFSKSVLIKTEMK
jgi:hypothetical protein